MKWAKWEGTRLICRRVEVGVVLDPSGHAGAGGLALAKGGWWHFPGEIHGSGRLLKKLWPQGQSVDAGSDQRRYISFLRHHSIKVAEYGSETPSWHMLCVTKPLKTLSQV